MIYIAVLCSPKITAEPLYSTPLVHLTLCRCQQYGAFSMKALARYQMLGEQRHIRCEQLAQGCCPNNTAVGVEPATSWSRVQCPTATPPSHLKWHSLYYKDSVVCWSSQRRRHLAVKVDVDGVFSAEDDTGSRQTQAAGYDRSVASRQQSVVSSGNIVNPGNIVTCHFSSTPDPVHYSDVDNQQHQPASSRKLFVLMCWLMATVSRWMEVYTVNSFSHFKLYNEK